MARKKTKLVYGVGINDADYNVTQTVNGKQGMCRFYMAWSSMLERCYSQQFTARWPTYIGCSVVKEWLTFSNFKSWMEQQDWEGKQLDKDIIIPGNKVYGPENCVFVTGRINTLLTDNAAGRGRYPIGVCLKKTSGKFQASIRKYGKRHFLGYHATKEAASAAYITAKVAHIIDVALTQPPNIKAGLLKHAEIIALSS